MMHWDGMFGGSMMWGGGVVWLLVVVVLVLGIAALIKYLRSLAIGPWPGWPGCSPVHSTGERYEEIHAYRRLLLLSPLLRRRRKALLPRT